jgi:hypothetical protein
MPRTKQKHVKARSVPKTRVSPTSQRLKNIKVPEVVDGALSHLCKELGVSKGQVVARAVDQYLFVHEEQVKGHRVWVVDEDGNLIRDLGEEEQG